MAEVRLIQMPGETLELLVPDVTQLVTEDDTPVDNLFSEKQQRLLVESLYTSWQGKYLAAANVAIYYSVHQPPVVPDVFLSLDVQVPENWYDKGKRSYFVWEFGKVPEVVIEIVSNTQGEENGRKRELYAQIGVSYYVIFDPTRQLSDAALRVYEQRRRAFQPMEDGWFEGVQLGVRLWEGEYEGKHAVWLRWYDRDRRLILTGAEHVEQERQRAEQERQRAEQERQRAERLAAQLRALGVAPEA